MPLSNYVPRGFGFVHHSITILYHEVPNPNLTIRNFFIAERRREEVRVRGAQLAALHQGAGYSDETVKLRIVILAEVWHLMIENGY